MHLNLLAEPKKVNWENSYAINYDCKSLAQNHASVLFVGCKSRLFLGEKMEVWKAIMRFPHK